MRNSGKGGMRTSGTHCSIYCPKCGKPAARTETQGECVFYLHFTKAGSIWHVLEKGRWFTRRRGPTVGLGKKCGIMYVDEVEVDHS